MLFRSDATSFALDSANALWSNATGAGREGLLVKRTLSGSAYAEADTVNTGLTAVDAVAVYIVNGVEYALAAALPAASTPTRSFAWAARRGEPFSPAVDAV